MAEVSLDPRISVPHLLRVLGASLCIAYFGCGSIAQAAPASAPNLAPAAAASAAAPVADEETSISPQSPRGSMTAYLSACRKGDFVTAARYLDVPKASRNRAPELARRLKAVLDRRAWVELDALSPSEAGNSSDGLPSHLEEIAQIRSQSGRVESVRLRRTHANGTSPSWVFSRSAVEHIDDWYDELGQRWVLERLPLWAQRSGPKEILVWQWIAIPPLVLLLWAIGRVAAKLTQKLLGKLAAITPATWDDVVVAKVGGPTTLAWLVGLLFAVKPHFGFFEPAEELVSSTLRGALYFTGIWFASRLIEVWGDVVGKSPWAVEHTTARALVPIAVRLGKITLLVVAAVAFVSAMGYPAASLIAGLGVGGLAVALAAQKTVENLFGAFTLGIDQPFRVGDFVKIGDLLGHVESIGLRSTKLRTLDRTMVSIANGQLSEMRIESYTARDRIRLHAILGLVYSTSSEQLREVLRGLESVLQAHEKIWPENVVVKFRGFGESALQIEVMAWFVTTDFTEFQGIREEVLLKFMEVVEAASSAFAFPTRTLHLTSAQGQKRLAAAIEARD